MSLGLYMGIRGDFTLAPAHAHLNLLGWVTMAVYGLYHRYVTRARNRLTWVKVACGAAGFPLMAGGSPRILPRAMHPSSAWSSRVRCSRWREWRCSSASS